MNNVRRTFYIMLLAATLLASCAGQPAPPPTSTPDIDAILTESVGTFAAYFYQTQTALVPPATSTPVDTPTPLPTTTPLSLPSPVVPPTQAVFLTPIVYPSVTATGTVYTPTVNPSTLGYGCNNLALINDLAIEGGSTLKPGQSFRKAWQVANTGTCDWTLGYRVVFVSGNDMGGEPSRPKNTIPPAKWTQLEVSLTAPNKPGTYTGYWKLSDGAGHTFGSLLGVTITVKESSYP